MTTRSTPDRAAAPRSEPWTLEELLAADNEPASVEMPAHLREAMSERRIHLSTAGGDESAATAGLAEELAKTSSFLLPEGMFLGRLGNVGAAAEMPDGAGESEAAPYRPPWADLVHHPKLAPVPTPSVPKSRDGTRIELHTVYPPENRTPFKPEGYPLRCIGRLEVHVPGQQTRFGTATLVGRRTIVTSAHLMPRNGAAGQWGVLFVPAFFDGGSTVGMASWCEQYRHVVHPNDVSDSTQDRDIAVLRLYDPLGDALGWFGIKTYDDDWEDEARWTLVGYPDITGNPPMRPTRQSGIRVIDDDPSGDWTEVEHRGDASSGNSGGPLWGTFPDGHFLIGVHSGGEYRTVGGIVAEDNNVASGGRGLPTLVNALNAQWS
ncbi:MAG: trypsin-like serine peptidase [Pseudonocardia sp.]